MNLTTIYDVMHDLAVRTLKHKNVGDKELCEKIYKDKAWQYDYIPDFDTEIRPDPRPCHPATMGGGHSVQGAHVSNGAARSGAGPGCTSFKERSTRADTTMISCCRAIHMSSEVAGVTMRSSTRL
jgi:hypothetical protein